MFQDPLRKGTDRIVKDNLKLNLLELLDDIPDGKNAKAVLRRSVSESDLSKSSSEELRKQRFGEALDDQKRTAAVWTPTASSDGVSIAELDSARQAREKAQLDKLNQLVKELGVPLDELQVLLKSGLLQQIPLNDQGQLTSLGSIYHNEVESLSRCSPCVFWFRDLCVKGIHCQFCHFRHKGQRAMGIKSSKKTRMRSKAVQGCQAEPGIEDGLQDFETDAADESGTTVRKEAAPSRRKPKSSGTRVSL